MKTEFRFAQPFNTMDVVCIYTSNSGWLNYNAVVSIERGLSCCVLTDKTRRQSALLFSQESMLGTASLQAEEEEKEEEEEEDSEDETSCTELDSL